MLPTCGEPVHGQVGEDDVALVEDGGPALVVHVPVHQRMAPHKVQHTVRQLPEDGGGGCETFVQIR